MDDEERKLQNKKIVIGYIVGGWFIVWSVLMLEYAAQIVSYFHLITGK